MLKKDKEQIILQRIEEITGKKVDINKQVSSDIIKNYRNYKIKKILLLSSSFDYFLIEEERRLSSLFAEWSSFIEQESPPIITQVETDEECISLIKKENFDLLIIFNQPNKTIYSLTKKTDLPIIIIGNIVKDLTTIDTKETNIEKISTWNGDGKIIISVIKNLEDEKNLKNLLPTEEKRIILLIEDSIQHYSSYLSLIEEEIFDYLKFIIDENLTSEQKLIRYKRRPFILHAVEFEKGLTYYEKYKDDLICIISDNYIGTGKNKMQAGINLAKKVVKEKPNLPILIQSSDPIDEKEKISENISFISKNSSNLMKKIRIFLYDSLAPRNLVFTSSKKRELLYVNNLKELEETINNLDNRDILKCTKKNHISKWLKNIGEYELAEKFFIIENEINQEDILKSRIIELLEDYKYSINQNSISNFSQKPSDPLVKINRIGKGALGGKARGIAFLAKILSKYLSDDMFPDLRITIPRSIVLSTDVFDSFMENNHFNDLDFSKISDERIAAKFLDGNIPATVLGDLRSFIRKTRKPLIVRSSGLLEDSLMQPFAGIYSSMLLPNESWETDLRFQEVCNSIKYVYASTYFEKARTYIKSTPKHIGDEKMAVLIQEVIGTRKGNYFYPTISGVAKSYNYYPSGRCNPEEGIAYLALGLGKSIVDGGSSFAFCPEKPKVPLFGTQKEYMRYAQNSFYALNMKSIYRFVDYNEETSLEKLDIDVAKKYGDLDKIASTYIYHDDRFYPGISEEGAIVIDFSPIVNFDELPLAKALKLLLNISEIALGYPVEIEFAINIPKSETEVAEIIILQIRNMVPPHKKIDINIDEIPNEDILFISENALGNGIYNDILDIVFIKQDTFDLSNSNQVVNQIRIINSKLMEEKKPYILIGPGRWGSSDPWLGIPVIWSDIAGSKIIIETPYKERHIDPSQGSHFFHDMIASQVGYLITKKQEEIDWNWINSQKIIKETEFLKHVKTSTNLQAIIDGKLGKAIIREKPKSEKKIGVNSNEKQKRK